MLLHKNGNALLLSTCSIYIYNTKTPCSRALLDRPLFLQVGKIFLAFMETEGSLSRSRQHLVPILSHINSVHAFPAALLNNYFNIFDAV